MKGLNFLQSVKKKPKPLMKKLQIKINNIERNRAAIEKLLKSVEKKKAMSKNKANQCNSFIVDESTETVNDDSQLLSAMMIEAKSSLPKRTKKELKNRMIFLINFILNNM
jgi:hypothetical protein